MTIPCAECKSPRTCGLLNDCHHGALVDPPQTADVRPCDCSFGHAGGGSVVTCICPPLKPHAQATDARPAQSCNMNPCPGEACSICRPATGTRPRIGTVKAWLLGGVVYPVRQAVADDDPWTIRQGGQHEVRLSVNLDEWYAALDRAADEDGRE